MTDEIAWLKECHGWTRLQSIIAVTATRESINKITVETRYFISSLSANNPTKLEHAARSHWAIENNLHWVLDIALNLIKKEKISKVGWDNDFLLRIIEVN